MKNSSSWYYMYHNYTIWLSSSQKALTYKALESVFRHWWVKFSHLTVNTESSHYNLTCAGRHLLLDCFRACVFMAETFVLCGRVHLWRGSEERLKKVHLHDTMARRVTSSSSFQRVGKQKFDSVCKGVTQKRFFSAHSSSISIYYITAVKFLLRDLLPSSS